MSIIRCSEGHFFDDSKFTSCPHCKAKNGKPSDAPNPTVPFTDREIIETVSEKLPGQQVQNQDANELADAILKAKSNKPEVEEVEKTIGIYASSNDIDPVVGWLVTVDGVDKGQDYRLKAGRNFIGRSHDMDVVISKDNAVSAVKHAIIVYDPQETIFIVMPGESHELFYLNGKVVLESASLKNYDKIKIGHTTLMFISCCNENFKWPVD